MNVVKNRWVFKPKTDAYGNVIRFKARLPGKGYSQVHWVDFDDTYAPVADSHYSFLSLSNQSSSLKLKTSKPLI